MIMSEQSRIRFNPMTKEIEIEGSEVFVKTYFDKLQAMMSGVTKKTKEKPKAVKRGPEKKSKMEPKGNALFGKKAGKVDKAGTPKKRVTHIGAVVELIQANREGTSTSVLKEKTGLTERQIWSIVDRAANEGKIRKIKRGLYGPA
jgi:hypothetical protein